MSDIHNSQSGVIVKHDGKTGGHKPSLHIPYSITPPTTQHHGHHGYNDYPPTSSSLNNSDRYSRQITQSTSPHQVLQSSIQSSPQSKGGPSPPSSTYNMVVVPAKQKVSSPAPSHIYGKPSENVLTIPHNRTQEIPQPTKPLFQPQIRYTPPPPAHSSRPLSAEPKHYPAPSPTARPPPGLGIISISHPHAASPLPPPESHTSGVSPHHLDRKNFSPSPKLQTPLSAVVPEQTQPLDLGVPSSSKNRGDSDASLRRKSSTPFQVSSLIEPKKMRIEPLSPADLQQLKQGDHQTPPPPMSVSPFADSRHPSRQHTPESLAKPGTPDIAKLTPSPKQDRISPLHPQQLTTTPPMLNSTTIINNSGITSLNNSTITLNANNGNSGNGKSTPTPMVISISAPVSTNTSPVALTGNNSNNSNSLQAASTPPSVVEPKSNTTNASTTSSSFTAPRHLKKAWLTRHIGEDSEDTTGAIGSGNCIKVPLKIESAAGTPITNNNVMTGNGKEEPAANNIVKLETNSVSGKLKS